MILTAAGAASINKLNLTYVQLAWSVLPFRFLSSYVLPVYACCIIFKIDSSVADLKAQPAQQ